MSSLRRRLTPWAFFKKKDPVSKVVFINVRPTPRERGSAGAAHSYEYPAVVINPGIERNVQDGEQEPSRREQVGTATPVEYPHVVIDSNNDIIPEEDIVEANNQSSSQHHRHDCNTCLSAYHLATYKLSITIIDPETEHASISCSKMVGFVTVSSVSLFHALGFLKYLLTKQPNVKVCIQIGYYANLVLLKSSYTWGAWRDKEETRSVLLALEKAKHLFPKSGNRFKVYGTVGIIFLTSIAQSFMESILSLHDFNEWNFETVVEWRAYDLGSTMVVWTRNKTQEMENFLDSISTGITPTTLTLAMISFVIDFIGLFHGHVIEGEILTTALTVQSQSEEFMEVLSKPSAVTETHISEEIWDMYEHLKFVSRTANEINENKRSYFHSASFILGAFFLFQCMNINWQNGFIFILLSMILRVALVYRSEAKSAKACDFFRDLTLEKCSNTGRINIGNRGKFIKTQLFIEELNTQPIGIKCNTFLIDSAFNIQFVGMVVHYFFLLLPTATSN